MRAMFFLMLLPLAASTAFAGAADGPERVHRRCDRPAMKSCIDSNREEISNILARMGILRTERAERDQRRERLVKILGDQITHRDAWVRNLTLIKAEISAYEEEKREFREDYKQILINFPFFRLLQHWFPHGAAPRMLTEKNAVAAYLGWGSGDTYWFPDEASAYISRLKRSQGPLREQVRALESAIGENSVSVRALNGDIAALQSAIDTQERERISHAYMCDFGCKERHCPDE